MWNTALERSCGFVDGIHTSGSAGNTVTGDEQGRAAGKTAAFPQECSDFTKLLYDLILVIQKIHMVESITPPVDIRGKVHPP